MRFFLTVILGLAFCLSPLGCKDDKKPAPEAEQATSAATPEAEGKEDKKEAPKAAEKAPEKKEAPALDRKRLSTFGKLPAHFGQKASKEVVALGRQLYYEARLSKNHDVSCNSCHGLNNFGVDSAPTSTGHKGQKGGRNAPTVMNAAGHLAQFWDGRAKDVEAQALGPILNPIEMALADEKAALAVLSSMPGYVDAFAKAFPGEGLTWQNVGRAIGAFERGLVTPSRFDKFLAGDETALSDAEKHGLGVFLETGCTQCHNGALVGGNSYQKVGVFEPWPNLADKGRVEVTKDPGDLHKFKVPSLRNIAKTGPYFHDGSVAELEKAVTMMARHQLHKDLKADEVKAIVTFLRSLTGEVDKDLVAKPELPASTDKTPKPDPT